MRYTQLKVRMEGIAKQLNSPDQNPEDLSRRMQYLAEEIMAIGKGNIYRVSVLNSNSEKGFIFLAGLDLGELQDYTERVLRFKFIDREPIPIGKFISGKTP